jgi:hypothetical protein
LKNPSTEKLQLKKKVTKGIFLSCRALDVTFFEIRPKGHVVKQLTALFWHVDDNLNGISFIIRRAYSLLGGRMKRKGRVNYGQIRFVPRNLLSNLGGLM